MNQRVKTVAVVIPFYKFEFFDACLQSLVNQTSSDFRVYIGDDKSPSDPTVILEKYRGQLDFSYKRFKDNLGGKSLVNHWNRCIELVEDEEWLMILGDDDKLGKECIKEFIESRDIINKLNINVARFATIKINENDQEISGKYVHPERENSLNFLFRKLNGETRSSLSEYIFRKKIVDKKKFKELPLAWHTDDLAILEFSNFDEVFSINSSIVYFRNSGINISTLTNNLREKNKASFMFYYTLLKIYHRNFTGKEKGFLFYRLEKAFLNDKKNFKFYQDYVLLRRENFNITDILIFIRKYFHSVKNGNTFRKIIKS